MAELHLPATLPSLFEDLPRTLEVEAGTVNEAIDRLDQRWPGVRDRLCEPGPELRRHINVYVDRERAGLDTRIEDGYIVLGETPGVGMVFDEEKLAKLEVEQLTPGVTLGSWGRRRGAGLFNVPPDEGDDLH